MDPFRARTEAPLRDEPRLTSKRIGRLLQAKGCTVSARRMRGYIASVRGRLFPTEVFGHRTHVPGKVMNGFVPLVMGSRRKSEPQADG